MKNLEKKADKLVWNYQKPCEICGNQDSSPHHRWSRRFTGLRWELRNIVWLCVSHHTSGDFSAHGSPKAFKRWFKGIRPDDHEYLLEKKNEISKFTKEDMKNIIEELNG